MKACPNGEFEPVYANGGRSQVRSRERVRDLAEVYTHEREVEAMLDLVPDMLPTAQDPGNIDPSFFEPACGDGNFLVEILRRKLEYVTSGNSASVECFEHRVLRCLSSIYGVDISEQNVLEARDRMRSIVQSHCDVGSDRHPRAKGFREAVDVVLETNVIRADTLGDAAAVELIEYKPISTGYFIREWFRPLEVAAEDLNLLSPPPRRDEMPIHYSELARSARWPVTTLVARDAA
jgi:hypothetical protein